MAGRMQYASHTNFGGGAFRDITRHLIPENGVYEASNVIVTNTGSLSKRGATVANLSSASTIEVFEIGSQRSAQIDGRERLYVVGRSGTDFEFGSMQTLASAQPLETFTSSISFQEVGRPSQFGDSVVFPANGSSVLLWAGGADLNGAAEYSVAATVNTSSGNNVLTIGSTPASNVLIGGYVHLSDGGTEEYTGRIVALTSTTITVEPAPIRNATFTQLDFYPILPQVGTRTDGEYVSSAGCVGVFSSGGDSRIVIGDLRVNTGSGTIRRPNRLMWAASEASDLTGVTNCDGLVQATRAGFPKRNFIDIEDIEQIIALVPIGANNMLVLGTKKSVMLSGTLLTETDQTEEAARRGGSTVAVRQFAQQVGCVSAKSVQATASGVMFAAEDGVYITDGSAMINTMENKIESSYSGDLTVLNPLTFDVSVFSGTDVFDSTNSALTVAGSANINDEYYYLSLTRGGFICNLRSNFAWTTVPINQFRIMGSAQDAKIASNRVYAIPFGLGTTSSTQKVLRIDPVFVPLGNVDADGTEINAQITTKTYTEGDQTQLRRFRHMLMSFEMTTGLTGDFTVEEIPGFDSAGVSSLSPSPSAAAATIDVRRYDIQIISQGIAYTIRTTGNPISFTLLQITNAYNNLRPGRVR